MQTMVDGNLMNDVVAIASGPPSYEMHQLLYSAIATSPPPFRLRRQDAQWLKA